MTFPVESEASIKRRILDVCQQHARNALEELERRIDIDVRNLDLELLSGKLPLPTMLFFREMVDRAQRIAGIALDVVDPIRVLAITA